MRDPADLGLGVLAALVRTTRDGMIFLDTDGRYVYANPAACDLIGYPLDTLVGRDFLADVPPWNRPSALAYLERARSGTGGGGSAVICRADGSERYVEGGCTVLVSGRGPLLAFVIRDVSERLTQQRKATALAQAAASVATGDSVEATVRALAECAVRGTRALGACVAFGDENDRAISVGTAGLPPGRWEAVRPTGWAHAFAACVACQEPSSSPKLIFQAHRVVFFADARRIVESDPRMASLAEPLRPVPWQAAACAPLVYRGVNVGVLVAVYGKGEVPFEAETAFLATLADQAAIAAATTRLVAVARRIVEHQMSPA